MSKPRLFIAGNWKMNKTAGEAAAAIAELRKDLPNKPGLEIAVCPSFLALGAALEAVKGSVIQVGSQNVHFAESGAFTGEVSCGQLKDAGISLAIIGHSERRQFFGETDDTVNKRTHAALKAGIRPITCIGETLAERQGGQTEAVLERQLSLGLAGLTPEQMEKTVLAYEPVWAIGTGVTASPQQAQEAHAFIRAKLTQLFGAATAGKVLIQYGGSVKPDNVAELMSQKDIDGALVGGASLKAAEFATLLRNAACVLS